MRCTTQTTTNDDATPRHPHDGSPKLNLMQNAARYAAPIVAASTAIATTRVAMNPAQALPFLSTDI